MSEHRDELEQWLGEPVQHMLPPPGTFELIRKRARRRKVRQAALSAAGVAAVVAVGVTVPKLVIPTTHLSTRLTTGSQSPSPGQHGTPMRPAGHSSAPVVMTSPTAGSRSVWVPPNFQVSSATFVGNQTGFVLGQAGTPGQCGPPKAYVCTSLARTDNAGGSWSGVPAPVAGAPNGSTGVSQVRFLNTGYGWVYGPQLFATTDGGLTWARVGTHGQRVTDLETIDGRVFAVWADCRGSGADFAAGCTSFSLYSSAAGTSNWAPVPGVTGLSQASGAPSSAFLVLTGTRGYLIGPNGELYSGPVSRASGWGPVTNAHSPVTLHCSPGTAQPDGVPSQAFLAATGSGGLVLFCPGTSPGSPQPGSLYYSTDGGATWQPQGTVPVQGTPTSLSGSPAGAVMLASASGIEVASSPAGPWQVARTSPAPGGFTYVGMTEANQGIAVAARQSLHGLWFTFNSGLRWHALQIP
ncbi:MAG TPA: hypothetical protein VGS19_05395 [Streptosporangiaceae bacterium]|nr:hypothetical protein [Streptosporangiaceae bacterium]